VVGDDPRSSTRQVPVAALVVTVALFGSNAASYVFTVLAARALAPGAFGELSSLLAVLLVGMVPAIAAQTAVALHVAADRRSDRGDMGMALGAGLAVGAVVGVLGLAASPALVRLLHVHDPLAVVLLAVSLAPLAVVNALRGALQGRQRFAAFAALVAAEAVARVGGALVGLLATRTPLGALLGTAAGSVAVALAAWVVCGSARPAWPGAALARTVRHATGAMLGLVVLLNLDVVLARQALPATLSGVYAVALVVNKIAYWLPQAVGVIALPRLADPANRGRVIRTALAVVVLLDAPVVLVSLAGADLLRLIGGAGYGVARVPVWLFALTGTLLAVAQLLLFSGIAGRHRLSTVPVWAAVAVEIVLVRSWLHHGVAEVAGAACGCAALLVAGGWLVERAAAGRAQAGRHHGGHRGEHRALGPRAVRPHLAVPEQPAGDRGDGGGTGAERHQQAEAGGPRLARPHLPRQHRHEDEHHGQHAAEDHEQREQQGRHQPRA
jgi:O-antigen/teichoic acid export membrane protein